jgi:hypothetical protein
MVLVGINVLIIALGIYWNGYLQYSLAFAQCRTQPILGSNFAGAYSYSKPGELGYGPSIFVSRYFCSEREAVDAGYSDVLNEDSLSNKEQDKKLAEYENSIKFSPDKVSFTALTPSYIPSGMVKNVPTVEDIHGTQVLQEITLNGVYDVSIRQGDLNSEYTACRLDPCQKAAKDDQGHDIFRSRSDNNGNVFWGIYLSDSFLNIEDSGNVLTQQDVVKMFSSMKPISQ